MSKVSKSQIPVPESVDSNSKIEAIKNLLFGENIQQYDTEFDDLKSDILKKKQELQSIIDLTRDELSKSIDSLSTDLNIRITELENKLEDRLESIEDEKMSREMLGKALIELGEKIKS